MSALNPPDPYRIKRILNKLEAAWETMPDKPLPRVLGRVMWSSEINSFDSDKTLEDFLDRYLKDHKVEGWKS